jgi:nucleoside-diphosphate-sugar epimerase
MAGPLAAVTGATGFLGARLTTALLAKGWRVRALVRRTPDPARLPPSERLDLVRGDLADLAALKALTNGADVTLHCAGLIKARRRADFFAVNRDGARTIASAVGAGRLVLISSLAAREPRLSDYAASKRAGEDAAREASRGRLTIVRPPAIYGPGDFETLALFKLAGRSPILPLPGGPAARLAVAHVDDVVDTILALIPSEAPPGPFAVGGDRPEGYAWREIFAAAAAAMDRRPAFVTLPAWFTRTAASASWAVGQLTGAAVIFTPGKAREVLHPDWSVAPGEQAPGVPKAKFNIQDGFAETVAWYRVHGWLN